MTARKELAYTVVVTDQDDVTHVFERGRSDVPAWAVKKITNPRAWVGGSSDAEADDIEDTPPSYSSMKKADLEAEVARRNEDREADDVIDVEGTGKVADLVAALEADDAAQADD